MEVHLQVNRGSIEAIKIFGDFFNKLDVSEVENLLIGTPHNEQSVKKKLSTIPFQDYFHNITVDEFSEGIV